MEPREEIVKFIFQQLLAMLPLPKMPAALTVAIPLILEFSQSSIVLNDDVRADIQLKLIRVLRKAGLEGYTS